MPIFSQLQKKLALRLAFNTAVVALVIAGIISTISIHSNIRTLKERQQDIASSIIASTLPAFNLATFNYNIRLTKQLTDGLVSHPNIVSAIVIDSTGTQLAQAVQPGQCTPSTLDLMIFNDPGIHIEALSYNDMPLGKLIIELDRCQSISEFGTLIRDVLLNALLLSLLLATFIYAAFYRAVTSPLTHLVRQITGVTAENLDQVDLIRMQSGRQDELGQLMNQFASLLSLLKEHIQQQQQAEATINSYSAKLEELIHKRTHALTHLNRRLQQSSDEQQATPAVLQNHLNTLVPLLKEPLNQLVNNLDNPEQTGARAMAANILGLLHDLQTLQQTFKDHRLQIVNINDVIDGCLAAIPAGQTAITYTPTMTGSVLIQHNSLPLLLNSLISNGIANTNSGKLALSIHRDAQQLFISLCGQGLFISEALLEQDLMPLTPANLQLPSAFGLGMTRELARCLGGDLQYEPDDRRGSVITCNINYQSFDAALMEIRQYLRLHPLRLVIHKTECRDTVLHWLKQWQLTVGDTTSRNNHHMLLLTDQPDIAERNSGLSILLPAAMDENPDNNQQQIASDLVNALLAQIRPDHQHSKRTIRVLLVDDNTINRMLCQRYLKNLNIETDTADNGLQAIDLARRSRYDLVLMDCQMPVMDGFEATRQIRRNSLNSHTPIIALTGLTGENERQQCLTAGMNDFIGKPFTQDQIQATLVQWINNYYGHASD
ncbi:MAG: response regulator [Saccharospirillaceae bacterium]|nr:response regulator [Saccharospirillaceae bacterium]